MNIHLYLYPKTGTLKSNQVEATKMHMLVTWVLLQYKKMNKIYKAFIK